MQKILGFSCLHAPITHGQYFNWLIGQIEEFKPDHIVNMGDWVEGIAMSRWPKNDRQRWTWYDELKALSEQAVAINVAAPSAKKYWLYGNHDDNCFGDHPDRIPADLREAVQWRNNKDAAVALKDWNVIDRYTDRTRLRLGPITFQHGTSANQSAEKDKAYLNGTPYGLYIQGHTHRPVELTQARERQVRLPYWYCNPGTGIDFDKAFYMERCSMALWGRGAVLIETPGVEHSRTAYASKQWDATVKIHSMAY